LVDWGLATLAASQDLHPIFMGILKDLGRDQFVAGIQEAWGVAVVGEDAVAGPGDIFLDMFSRKYSFIMFHFFFKPLVKLNL